MLYEIPHIESRAINAENPTGGKSGGGFANGGRKGAPCLQNIAPGAVVTLADIQGSGVINHIWMTFGPEERAFLRCLVLRMYWDGQTTPSVEVPVGDFFGVSHARFRSMESELMTVQNNRGLNTWIPMPFRKAARITIENDSDSTISMLFFQIDYVLGVTHEKDTGYFHAQFRRANRQTIHTDYVILDGVRGRGRYLGTVLGVRDACDVDAWWGEGEIKMYFDGETQPTICGTGTEDYIGFAWGLKEGCFPQQGCTVCDNENGYYSEYRWHTKDPIIFEESIKVTVQQIGYGSGAEAKEKFGADFVRYPAAGAEPGADQCYYDRSDDYCSVAYWYQTLPTNPFPPLPDRAERVSDLMIE